MLQRVSEAVCGVALRGGGSRNLGRASPQEVGKLLIGSLEEYRRVLRHGREAVRLKGYKASI
jgi:hypothetical protein